MPAADKWAQRYFDLAHHVAQWSRDPSTKVGAVAIGRDRRRIALGYNGFPPGIFDADFRLQTRDIKYKLIQHAERNVLDNATFSLVGGTLAVTMHPCVECAKSIISKGISLVICPPKPQRGGAHWESDGSAEWAEKILAEAGIEILIIQSEE